MQPFQAAVLKFLMQLRVVVYRTGLSHSFVCYKKCRVFASNRLSVSVS